MRSLNLGRPQLFFALRKARAATLKFARLFRQIIAEFGLWGSLSKRESTLLPNEFQEKTAVRDLMAGNGKGD